MEWSSKNGLIVRGVDIDTLGLMVKWLRTTFDQADFRISIGRPKFEKFDLTIVSKNILILTVFKLKWASLGGNT